MRKAVKKRSRNVVKVKYARKFGNSYAKNYQSRPAVSKVGRKNGVGA